VLCLTFLFFSFLDHAHRFVESPPTSWQSASLPGLPNEESFLENPPTNFLDLIAQVHDLAGLYWEKEKFGSLPTEDELIAHYVCRSCVSWAGRWKTSQSSGVTST